MVFDGHSRISSYPADLHQRRADTTLEVSKLRVRLEFGRL